MIHEVTDTPEPRPLTNPERTLLRWLLGRGAEITGTDTKLASAFLPQLDAVQVIRRCGCGCPTIDLALVAPDLVVPGASATLADVEGCSPEGGEIGVILRASNGMLSQLELYARDGRVPFTIPGAEQLQSFW